jgi:cell division protease FtsH
LNSKQTRVLTTILLWAMVLGMILYMVLMGSGVKKPVELTLKDFLTLVEEDKVAAVKEELGSGLFYGLRTGSTYQPKDLPGKADFYFSASEEDFNRDLSLLLAKKTGASPDSISTSDYPFVYSVSQPKGENFLKEMLPYLFMGALVLLIMWWFMRQQGNSNRQMAEFSKARAREMSGSKNPVTFKDVAGADEEKAELQEIVEFLRAPQRFTEVGARIPKGVLLVGPPGTGKTLLAKAVAGEAGVPFYSISGSDFVELFVGVGASRVRDLFNTAKRSAPAIIFIDEIDAVGRHRGSGLGGGHDEREQTLNQMLVEMDGFSHNQGIIVMAATNRPDILDPALLRPGRFDRRITVGYPDVGGREAILKVHARNKKFEDNVDMKVLARRTPGFTGADLENLLNEAAILAGRARRKKISMQDLEESITRVMMGPEKKSRIISEEDRRYTAYHESGHAILAIELPKCDKVHEVSIISRGMAAGYTMTMPKDDLDHVTKRRLEDYICMCMGGRVAEELVFGDISAGASQDLKNSTQTARRMVSQYGMSQDLGPVFYGGDAEVFIGRDLGHSKDYSEEIAGRIDEEVHREITEQYERARTILSREREALDRVSALLLKYERVTGEEFERVYRGEDMDAVMASAASKAETAPNSEEIAEASGAEGMQENK